MPIQANTDRFRGLGDVYDANRPAIPPVVVDLLCRYALVDRPALVLDLGCGTGLSTRVWAGRAKRVVGIEPNADMRRRALEALAKLPGGEVDFCSGHSHDTGLEAGSADIITCSQSLHWMEPEPTFAEAARILRPGGVFAAIDYDLPPAIHWGVDAAFLEMARRVRAFEGQTGAAQAVRWEKSGHLGRMEECGRFRFVREVVLHGQEEGDASRLEGLVLSLGGVAMLLSQGLDEETIGLAALRETARRVMGEKMLPWVFGYRVRLAVK